MNYSYAFTVIIVTNTPRVCHPVAVKGDHGYRMYVKGTLVHFLGCSIYHFKDGKNFKQQGYGNLLEFMQRPNVIPAPG